MSLPLTPEEERAKALTAAWRARGTEVTWEEPVPMKLRVRRERDSCPVTFYASGKVVLQGNPSTLRDELARWGLEQGWEIIVQPTPANYKGPRFDF